MATFGVNFIIRSVILSICLSFSMQFVDSNVIPSKSQVEHWVGNLSMKLGQSFEYDTVVTPHVNKGDFLKKWSMEVKFEKLDPKAMVTQLAEDLSKMLGKKMDALNNSVNVAQTAAANHDWKNNINEETKEELLKSKEMLPNDTLLQYSDRFGQNIIPNMSSIHIPVEIYSGDIQILNGLKWSSALDTVFYENYEKDPEILWQYFGSQTGFMRTLPASIWDTGDAVDLYDVRRRPWYTQGSSSPKDMLILIDTSGSVHGQALELMKVAVESLLDTLGENDFVNIASFSDKARSVSDCFHGTFVQASYKNKQKLIEEVKKIEAKMMADFTKGFEFAFKQFEQLKNQTNGRRGAECNRMIMLLTDGGTENAEEVFNKFNPRGNKTYRVFTYAIGPTANPVAAIRWMACANRGYFSQIPAMGAVRSKVQEYVDVISRPQALKRISSALWTSIYQGHEEPEYVPVIGRPPAILNKKQFKWDNIYHDSRGLGMMTTVTLPVYNVSEKSSNQTILGVMGIDVTTDAMLKHAPLRKFGPNGFPFAINSNGYIVFHPNLKIQKDLKDPPNVDILDLEVESEEKEKMRNDMIDMKNDTITVDTLTIANDERHVDIETGEKQRTYSFVPIKGTSFSVGVSIPVYQKHHMTVKGDIPNIIQALMNQEPSLFNMSFVSLLIADWDYYDNFTAGNLTGSILDLQAALENSTQYTWNEELMGHLLFDLNIASVFEGYWRASDRNGPVGAFLSTVGGLTSLYPKSCTYKQLASKYGDCSGKSHSKCWIRCVNSTKGEEMLNRFTDQQDTWKASYFKRAIDSSDLLFTAPYILDAGNEVNGTVGDITIMKSFSITNPSLDPTLTGDLNYKAGVLGGVYTHQYILDIMDKGLTLPGGSVDCRQPDKLACHLLDDGAFLIATNQPHLNMSVGRFFGKVDPEVMREMYNQSLFNRLEQYEYQVTCLIPKNDGTTSAGSLAFNIPSMTLFYELLTFNWWTSVVTWTFTNFNIYNLFSTSPTNFAEAGTTKNKTEICDRKKAQYYFTDLHVLEGQTECHIRNINCSRDFIAHHVTGTNLLLVISEPEKEDCELCKTKVKEDDILQEPTKITPTESNNHFCSIEPRYRRPTSMCYDNDPREDDSKCAGSLTHPVSFLVTSLVTMATITFIMR